MLAGQPAAAQLSDGDRGRAYGRRDAEWRPVPPLVHGYWGRRRWQRYSEDDGFRPGMDGREGYGRNWR
ncbi:MAG: hypothetical protein DI527_11810 [Chelatococcus sp.]|nr:MAG: hypothetical protein DI527_11810 [Chelatococcus sp.]